MGFLLCRIFILLGSEKAEGPPRAVCMAVLIVLIGVVAVRLGRWRVRLGLRVDFRVRDMAGCVGAESAAAGAEPGGAWLVEEEDLGGSGYGGCGNLGRVYCVEG